ncbi:2-amino-4-hydroxy-6-hydroxymethyldihydropteridine diphosphokinase [bacterium]|nr:2-amino-4-hydroxy-6-hydroxymethyldihydropteridine diphosphokinase [bacterium]
MSRVLISMGSNQNNPHMQIKMALDKLMLKFGDVTMASFYLTQAVGEIQQPDFINTALCFETSHSAGEILDFLQYLEHQAGRDRVGETPKGPRNLDLDLILFGNLINTSENLHIPHPRFRERRFVLEPATEIAGDMIDPVTQKSITQLVSECRDSNWVSIMDNEILSA